MALSGAKVSAVLTALRRCAPAALSLARQLKVSDEKALRSALRFCRLLGTQEAFQWADELPFEAIPFH